MTEDVLISTDVRVGRLSLNLTPEQFADRVKSRLLAVAPE